MNHQLTAICLYIFTIYNFGLFFLQLFFHKVYKKNNLFLNLGYCWLLGNFSLGLTFYYLSLTNNFYLLSWNGLLIIGSIVFGLNILLFFLKKSYKIKFQLVNLIIFFLLVVLYYPLLKNTLFTPMRSWDALAMWLMKAKSFFYSAGLWDNQLYTKPGFDYLIKAYPISFSLLIAGFYKIINQVNDQLIQFYLAFFYLNVVFVTLGYFITLLKNKWLSLMVCLITILIPNFFIYAANGYADLPLAMVVLIGFVSYLLYQNSQDEGYIFLFILSGGLAASFKNDGLPFLMITLVLGGLILGKKLLVTSKLKTKVFLILKYLLMTIITVVPLIVWSLVLKKLQLVHYFDYGTINLQSLRRLSLIYFYYMAALTDVSKYGLVIVPLLLLIIYEITYRLLKKDWLKIIPGLIILGQLAAYTLAYLKTPLPLELHLQTSAERVFLQIMPAFLVYGIYLAKERLFHEENPN